MNLDITHVLGTAACLVVLACGHEASAPSASSAPATLAPSTSATVAEPAATATTTTAAPLPAPPVTGIAAGPSLPVDPRAASPTVPAQRCIQVDDERGGTRITLEGRVFVDPDFAHPTRGKTHPFILHLDTPRCAIGTEEASIVQVHLAASEDIALRPLAGKHVRVSGDPFAAHTAWHARPVILMATRIGALP